MAIKGADLQVEHRECNVRPGEYVLPVHSAVSTRESQPGADIAVPDCGERDILFMAPTFGVLSEIWLKRTFNILRPYIRSTACFSTKRPTEPRCSLQIRPGSRFRRLVRAAVGGEVELQLLALLLKTQGIKRILINYATMAVATLRAWENTNTKVFVYCHGWDIHLHARSEAWPHKLVHNREYAEKLRGLSSRVTFIANSEFTKGVLVEAGIPEQVIRVNYFGVPTPALDHRTEKASQRELRLLFLGRLMDCKGPDLVIKSFEKAVTRGLHGRLIIAGDGPVLNACELLKADSKFSRLIEIRGPVDETQAHRLYSEADLFVCLHRKGPITQREEAFGVTIIEAMSYGLPVITGRSGGVPESVRHGETGFLVEPGDVDAHSNYILRLATDAGERRRIGLAAARHVQKNFSPRQEQDGLFRILRS